MTETRMRVDKIDRMIAGFQARQYDELKDLAIFCGNLLKK